MDAYVGFYWTFPVNWNGFRSLPIDVKSAAAASRTIRYQMERARRYVGENDGRLVEEIVFMDARPDRATEFVREPLDRARRSCVAHRGILLYVEFDRDKFWRHNLPLRNCLRDWGESRAVPLPPDPLIIDGKLFNPGEHFQEWRDRDREAMANLDRRARDGLVAAVSEIPEKRGRYRQIADVLNEREIRTFNGGRWTPENVRKALRRGKAENSG